MSMELFISFLIATIAAIQDAKQFKISNQLTYSATAAGLIWHTFFSGGRGFAFSGTGVALAFGCLFIVFALGGFGAGDVKLMMSLGAWLGPIYLINVMLISLIINGVVSLIILTHQRDPDCLVSAAYLKSKAALVWFGFGSRRRDWVASGLFTPDADMVPFGVMVLIGMVGVFYFRLEVL